MAPQTSVCAGSLSNWGVGNTSLELALYGWWPDHAVHYNLLQRQGGKGGWGHIVTADVTIDALKPTYWCAAESLLGLELQCCSVVVPHLHSSF